MSTITKVGDKVITNVVFGDDTQVLRLYKGDDLIWEHSGLPSGYEEIKYMTSSHVQYIDTGIILDPNYCRLEFKYNRRTASDNDKLFGSFDSSAAKYSMMFYMIPSSIESAHIAYGSIWPGLTQIPGTDNRIDHEVIFELSPNGLVPTVDGITASTMPFSQMQNTYTMYLYGVNTDGQFDTTRNAYVRIYYFKIYNTSTYDLVRDFVPCLDNNGVPCMYDKVSGQSFYNLGAGQFGYEKMDGTIVPIINS
jgi:hypothetical protein